MTARDVLAAAMTEGELLDAVVGFARTWHWRVWHVHDSRREVGRGDNGEAVLVGDSDAAGFPDLVLCHPGRQRLIFAELKSQKGTASPAQKDTLAALSQVVDGIDGGGPAGPVRVCVWRPVDWLDGTIEGELRTYRGPV